MEKKFYGLSKKQTGSVNGSGAGYIKNWDNQFYESGWYDLAAQDNEKLINVVLHNLKTAGLAYFDNFKDIDEAIHFLSEYPVANFETIIDLYIMTERVDKARSFFENNKSWHEEQVSKADPDFMTNRLQPYELRKNKLAQL